MMYADAMQWEVKQLAANRRSELRTAFIRHDHSLKGEVAPYLVADIIKSMRVDVSEEMVLKYMRHGRFAWLDFCEALEKQLAQYMTKEGYIVKAPSYTPTYPSASPRPQTVAAAASPRRLPALLRAGPGPFGESLRPQALSPRSPRSVRESKDARLMRIHALAEDVSGVLSNSKSTTEASEQPWLLTRAARKVPVTASPEAPPTYSPRLCTALGRVVVTPSPRLSPRGLAPLDPLAVPGLPTFDWGRGARPKARPGAASTVMGSEVAATTQDASAAVKPKTTPVKLVAMLRDALANHYTEMYKAFKYVDLDGDGRVDKTELLRAMKMWNIPVELEDMDGLMRVVDVDSDGQIDYKEFVDMLARDTVAPAAMGKRDMQAKEAMGVDSLDPEYLGHHKAAAHAKQGV